LGKSFLGACSVLDKVFQNPGLPRALQPSKKPTKAPNQRSSATLPSELLISPASPSLSRCFSNSFPSLLQAPTAGTHTLYHRRGTSAIAFSLVCNLVVISWDRPSAGYRDVLIQLELPSEAHGPPSILIHISNMGLIEKIQASKFFYARTCVAKYFYSPSSKSSQATQRPSTSPSVADVNQNSNSTASSSAILAAKNAPPSLARRNTWTVNIFIHHPQSPPSPLQHRRLVNA